MSSSFFIGVDNGTTGSIAILGLDGTVLHYDAIPVFNTRDYIKEVRYINRIDRKKLAEILSPYFGSMAYLEYPLINSQRFDASIVAARAYEALLSVLEDFGIKQKTITAKEWQKVMIPNCGTGETKMASFEKGFELFPEQVSTIYKMNEADALLIAEYCRRKEMG